MVRRLDMQKTRGIEHLYVTGMSKRKIAKTNGINLKPADRHLAEFQPKGARADQGNRTLDAGKMFDKSFDHRVIP